MVANFTLILGRISSLKKKINSRFMNDEQISSIK